MKYVVGGAWGCDHAPSGLCNLVACRGYATCVLARPAKPVPGGDGRDLGSQEPSPGENGGQPQAQIR